MTPKRNQIESNSVPENNYTNVMKRDVNFKVIVLLDIRILFLIRRLFTRPFCKILDKYSYTNYTHKLYKISVSLLYFR